MEIVTDERTYEGLHAVPALVMAAMESSGIRQHIDDQCRSLDSSCCKLSVGMAVKAMLGTMVERGKRPLYQVHNYYSTAPVDKIFGSSVEHCSLSDTVLAERLDTLFLLDGRKVLSRIYELLRDKYGFDSRYMFMDATNYTMFGLKYLEQQVCHDIVMQNKGLGFKQSALPAYGGNAKDGRNDLVQLNLSHVVDENGIPICSKSYDGNASDITMNGDMIEYLCREYDMKSMVLMADCKLCVEDLLLPLIQSDMRFITKVPFNFNGKLKEAVIKSISSSEMDDSPYRPGRKYYQTCETIGGKKVRIIAYLLPKSRRESEEFLHGNGLNRARKKMRTLKSRRFFCEKDALDEYRMVLGTLDADCYTAEPKVYTDEAAEARHDHDGKLFRVDATDIAIDETKLEDAIISHSVQVLITNLPYSDRLSEDKRRGACADDVIDLYLEQYKTEAGFKMMKSGMNIADVYIHTPSRITAVAFIVSLATMICKTLDYVLRKKKPKQAVKRTMKILADEHLNTLVKYDRAHDRLTVMGPPGATAEIFQYVERLEINPQHLLGY